MKPGDRVYWLHFDPPDIVTLIGPDPDKPGKVLVEYDNEVRYSVRLADLAPLD